METNAEAELPRGGLVPTNAPLSPLSHGFRGCRAWRGAGESPGSQPGEMQVSSGGNGAAQAWYGWRIGGGGGG